MLQQLNVVSDSRKSTLVLSKYSEKGVVMTFQFINNTVIFLLMYVK